MTTPPKLLLWLLDRCCPASRCDLKGDFLELYEHRMQTTGRFRAGCRFLIDSLSVVPLKFIIREEFRPGNSIALVVFNLKVASRNLVKNKGFTTLNIAGLALGLATCMLIMFYVIDELSYDRYHTKSDRIFRINTEIKFGGTSTSFAIAAPPMADALIKTFPEAEKAVRLIPNFNTRFAKGNEVVQEERVLFSDSTLFDVFTLPVIHGDPTSALASPNSVVVTESMAKKYFNRVDVVGETMLEVNDSMLYKITGVIRDMPLQSHFAADFFLSMHAHRAANDVSFNRFTFNTYVLLKPGADEKALEEKFPDFLRTHLNSSMNVDEFEKSGNYIRINLIPLTAIHLQSNRQRELGVNGSMEYIYMFSIIAMLILVLACINFMNLSTSRSAERAREVGIRKVMGSLRKQLVVQFLSESMLVTFGSAVMAMILAWVLLPYFNEIAGKGLTITWENAADLVSALFIITFLVGILAGSYPAFFLSSFQPVQVLKGKRATGFRGSRLRNILVVFQFSISTFLIIGTLVIYNQLDYIRNKDLGFNRQQVLIIKNANALDNPQILKDEVKQLPGVLHASLSGYLPTGGARWQNNISVGQERGLLTEFWLADADYVTTMGMTLLKGRNFSENIASDSLAMIINETAAKMLGYTIDPLEKPVHANNVNYHIIGVIKDFNFNSLRDNITPLVFVMGSDMRASLAVRIEGRDAKSLLEQVKLKWKILAPNRELDYSFMDKDFEALYNTEQGMQKLFWIFTSLAIAIASLGLFGLSAYAAEQRNREISIRKVLGASVTNLLTMLSGDFMKLVVVSILIAVPSAWIIMQRWIQTYAYRDTIPWWSFVIAACGTILIALITISFQSVRAALVNPAENLRSE